MSEWKEVTLEKITTKIGSGATPTGGGNSYKKDGISLFRSQNVLDFKFTKDGLAYIDDTQAFELRNVEVKENDILINITGESVTRCCIVPTEYLPARVNQHVSIIRANSSLADHKFIFYYIHSIKPELHSMAEIGCTRRALTKSMLENLDILLPPLPEQRAIASVLSSLDDKIDLLHRQNKTIEALAETLFRKMFIEDAPQPSPRPSPSGRGSEEEEAHEGWEEGKLNQYVDIGIGRTPPRQEHEWFSKIDTDVKWISIKDLGNDGLYIFNTAEYLTHDAVAKFNIPVIPENTVVLSFKMTVGRVAITTETMLSNEAIAHFKFRQDTPFSVEFLYLFLKNYQYETLGSTSSIVTAINSAMIKEIVLVVPDSDLLSRFDFLVKNSFKKIRSNQQQIRTLEKLRDTLLPKLMSGEVRVKV